jgi:hypothetical protein
MDARKTPPLDAALPALVEQIVASYTAEPRTHRIDQQFLASKRASVEACELLLELTYPGFHGRRGLTRHNISYHVGDRYVFQGIPFPHVVEHLEGVFEHISLDASTAYRADHLTAAGHHQARARQSRHRAARPHQRRHGDRFTVPLPAIQRGQDVRHASHS